MFLSLPLLQQYQPNYGSSELFVEALKGRSVKTESKLLLEDALIRGVIVLVTGITPLPAADKVPSPCLDRAGLLDLRLRSPRRYNTEAPMRCSLVE